MDGTRRRRAWIAAVPLITLVVGVLLATSAELAHGTDLRAGRRAELADLIAAQEKKGERYRRRIEKLRAQIQEESRRAATRDSRIQEANTRARKFAAGAAATPVTGTGLRVTLDDAPQTGNTSQLPGNPTPNDLVVHEQDVQAVINALWAGGADAVQVMDQRIHAGSAIRCVGNTLILHGVVYSPPYTITAVGDPDRLLAALEASPLVRIYLQYVEAYGLGYDVERLEKVTLPGYDSPPELEYATVLEQ